MFQYEILFAIPGDYPLAKASPLGQRSISAQNKSTRANVKKNSISDATSSSSEGTTSSQSEGRSSDDPPETVKFRTIDEFVAGFAAAFINTTTLFPINKLIFRQMVSGQRIPRAYGLMREDGLRYLYRGILPPLIQKMASVSVMFGCFEHYSKWADNKFPTAPPVANLVLAAILTGTTEAVLTPLERVQMLLQDRKYHNKYKNTLDALIRLRQFGSAEYYRGLTCVLVRNGPSNILFFGLRGEIKKFLPGYEEASQKEQISGRVSLETDMNDRSSSGDEGPQFKSLQSGHNHLSPKNKLGYDFLSGAILGAAISTLFYPLSVVRTRMQTRAPGTEFLSIVEAFKQVYHERDRRFTKFFRGCSINVARQFISWGVTNCSYEFAMDYLRSIK